MKTNYKLKHNIELAITKKFNQTNKSKATARLAPPQWHVSLTVSRRATVRNTKVLSKSGF